MAREQSFMRGALPLVGGLAGEVDDILGFVHHHDVPPDLTSLVLVLATGAYSIPKFSSRDHMLANRAWDVFSTTDISPGAIERSACTGP